jgi:zinc transport system substrate-binding protein
MRRGAFGLCLSLVLVLALAACGSSAGGGDDDRPTVVAGFYPLAWAAERSAGEAQAEGGAEWRIVNLTPAGAEPHDLELSAGDVELVRDADVVLYVGGFQPALEKAIAERDDPSLDVLLTAEERDPHVWLDPVRFARIVAEVDDALGAGASSVTVFLELDELDQEFRRGLARCERREIVTAHAAFGHLATRYGLEQLALAGSSPEAEPTPQELEQLIDDVRASGATTVFAEPLVSDDLAETVAREVGAEVAVLDPLEGLSEERLEAGEDYLSVMRENLAALREALGCG